jgi:hypothetical protein
MKNIKYKVSIVLLSFLCCLVLFINNKITLKINQQILAQDNLTVNVKPKNKYTLYDALNAIYKYEGLEVIKVNLEEKDNCHIDLNYKGDINLLSDIFGKLAKIEEVNEISNISINKYENNAKFSVNFMLFK